MMYLLMFLKVLIICFTVLLGVGLGFLGIAFFVEKGAEARSWWGTVIYALLALLCVSFTTAVILFPISLLSRGVGGG